VATVSTIQNILKTLYPQTAIPELAYADSPLLGRMKKTTDFEGENMAISNRFAGTGGGSATFATAQANISGAKYGKFLLTRARDYSLLRISTEAVRASASNRGSLVKAIKSEGDAAFYTMGRSMSRTVYGNGGGARGVIASGAGTATLTLTDPNDIVNFEVGMMLSASTTDGTSGVELGSNATRITAVDRDLGTITAGANFHGDFANGNYLFRHGDHGQMAKGLDGWLPGTAPGGGDSWFGFNRSVDTSRHAGVRYVATAAADGSIERALINATGRAAREGAKPDECYVHPVTFTTLVNELGAKANYERMAGQGMNGAKAEFGFKALVLHSAAGGELNVMADADCPRELAYLLTQKTWCFYGLGALPGFIDDDGKSEWLRVYNADSMEARIGYYGQIGCEAPGHNVRIDLSDLM
jgi:hypothetical protein